MEPNNKTSEYSAWLGVLAGRLFLVMLGAFAGVAWALHERFHAIRSSEISSKLAVSANNCKMYALIFLTQIIRYFIYSNNIVTNISMSIFYTSDVQIHCIYFHYGDETGRRNITDSTLVDS